MVIGGIIALVGAAVALLIARSQRKSLRAMTLTETLTCGELGQLSAAAAEAVGGGSFGQACEVVGAAAPGAGGALTAPESGREVVWHRTVLTEHYTATETDSQGKSREVDKTRVVARQETQEPFVVRDATGEIVVDPRGADFDEPFVLVDKFERNSSNLELGDSKWANIAEQLAKASIQGGIQHEEWGIPVGQQLYVLAEANDRTGTLSMSKPSEGRFLISTRSEEALRKEGGTAAGIATGVGVVAGIAGVVLVVLGLLG
jgi:gas vesicle protein